MEKIPKTIIKTFDQDIYIINNKTPDQISDLINSGGDMVRMPNGSSINKKSISAIQSYEDYNFQSEQKQRHKKGQFLINNTWYDGQGSLGIKAGLDRITGEISKTLLINK